ncbi:patatin-like phospholipase family protein [Carboxydothermus hydrogenoformans]|uniref:Patatin family protein n=1 Tax=Carboxydothermus hydrogenoformans (strain ATCC BAA-161 / DSM 6008 / Z-2901) TaxID=246194 RepID=Q3AAC7_CARHZ|nr:patatin-like phospholipase family protein [Carboxydothermus hydrogenoformans]ABB14536.1 patatin family protein [Carboxydothermus hydrogenoformans Z-2901]
MKEWGLALGGGFLRGAAHIGVLKVLEKEGLKPSIVSGTSVGGIIALLYGAGLSPKDMEELALQIKPKDLYNCLFTAGVGIFIISYNLLKLFGYQNNKLKLPLGIFRPIGLQRKIVRELGTLNINQLKEQVAVISVDLYSGKRVVFGNFPGEFLRGINDYIAVRDALLVTALEATSAVPGIFTPVKFYDYLLTDGGVVENVPVRILANLGYEKIIGVALTNPEENKYHIKNIIDVLGSSMEIIMTSNTEKDVERFADLVLRPRVSGMDWNDFALIPWAIRRGEEEAYNNLDRIAEIVS